MDKTLIQIVIVLTVIFNNCWDISSLEMTEFKKYPVDDVKMKTFFQVTSVSSRGECLMICSKTTGCICVSFNTLSTSDNCAISDNSLITGNVDSVTGWKLFYDPVAYARANHCTTEWTIYGHSCYKLIETKDTYWDAKALCETYPNGHLVDISSFGETMVVSNIVNARYPEDSVDYGQKVWCGLNDLVSEGTHKWSDGSTLTAQSYSRWEGSEPIDIGLEDCVQLVQRNNMYWNDVACSWQFISVCEIDIIV